MLALRRFRARRAARRHLVAAYRREDAVLHGLEAGDRVYVGILGPDEHVGATGTVWWADPAASTVILVELDFTGEVVMFSPGDLETLWPWEECGMDRETWDARPMAERVEMMKALMAAEEARRTM